MGISSITFKTGNLLRITQFQLKIKKKNYVAGPETLHLLSMNMWLCFVIPHQAPFLQE